MSAEIEARLNNLEEAIIAFRMNFPPQDRELDVFDVPFLKKVDAGRILDAIRKLSTEMTEQLGNLNEVIAAKFTDNYVQGKVDELASTWEQLQRLEAEFIEILIR